MENIIISLGGSIIVPKEINISFLSEFRDFVLKQKDKRFIIICGGGFVCREYQNSARKITDISSENLDLIGIATTKLNAELVRGIFGDIAYQDIINDPNHRVETDKKIIIGAGFKPGSSTDLRAVQIAKVYNAKKVINVSNIDYVYDKDPKKFGDAKKLLDISWDDFRKLVGNEWVPGLNMPFDPMASKEAQELGLSVLMVRADVNILENAVNGSEFDGTIIHV
jgi:uridylate kinase